MCSILEIVSHQVPKESWNKNIKNQGFKPTSFLPLASCLPAAWSPWALDWHLHFNPESCFSCRFPTSPASDVWVEKLIKKYPSCLFAPLFSPQSKILLQFPCAKSLWMRNHSERLGEAATHVLVSQSACFLYPAKEDDELVVTWLCLPVFTQTEMACIDKGWCARSHCISWNPLQAWWHNQAHWVIVL